MNVQIISKDTSYNPFDEDESVVGMDDIETGVNYKPKVSTWVFPRPKDISKEYGGGRTLKKDEKGQNIIESKEETEARENPRGEKVGEVSHDELAEHDERGRGESA